MYLQMAFLLIQSFVTDLSRSCDPRNLCLSSGTCAVIMHILPDEREKKNERFKL